MVPLKILQNPRSLGGRYGKRYAYQGSRYNSLQSLRSLRSRITLTLDENKPKWPLSNVPNAKRKSAKRLTVVQVAGIQSVEVFWDELEPNDF